LSGNARNALWLKGKADNALWLPGQSAQCFVVTRVKRAMFCGYQVTRVTLGFRISKSTEV